MQYTTLGRSGIKISKVCLGGTSEEYIGRALRELGVPRDQVVLASKAHFNEDGFSAAAIEREIEGSLRRPAGASARRAGMPQWRGEERREG